MMTERYFAFKQLNKKGKNWFYKKNDRLYWEIDSISVIHLMRIQYNIQINQYTLKQ